MTPERWQQVETVLRMALDRAPGQWAAFLDEACAGDPALRREVASLLAQQEGVESFMETPAVAGVSGGPTEGPTEAMIGRRIGPYKILKAIGHGGMGAVYLAERADDEYCKQVAIKLVKRGLDTDAIVHRFRHERQILATLDHPNIAKLLDGGTTEDGLSYFIMDYVEGQPLNEYCDTHQLSITERLELFRTVCSAVAYAHEHHIAHRDLKPSNILVTSAGVPKLLDFGIAKLLNPEAPSQTKESTIMGLRPMTPEYASPEQVRGEAITLASDVYSLGVLLYELLTGHRPYHVQAHTLQEVEHIVCEKEPEKPSTAIGRVEAVPSPDGAAQITITPESVSATRADSPEKLRRRLAGDLDNIVLMALRKEPARRYTTVAAFSEDIGRHLEGRPVIACRDSLAYRSRKFLTRNKAGVIAAAIIAVVLLAVVGVELYRLPPRNPAIEKSINSMSMLPKVIGSVAVLPLENLSRDPEQEYFADGMTEALITNLAQVRALRVIARTSVMRYKGARTPPREIAQRLGVDALIEGSVQRVGRRVKITAKLIHAATEQSLWAQSYERDLRDILVLQDEVAQAITQEIRIGLTPQEQKRMASARPVDYAAYEAYLKARAHFWNTYGQRELEKSIGYYRLAIEKDPHYALAYAGLAECYGVLGAFAVLAPDQSFPHAEEAAQRALSLDETLAEAHHAMADVKLFYRWDLTGAEHEIRRAIELNPGYAIAHNWYANLLLMRRQWDAALAEHKRAVELDPLSLVFNAALTRTFVYLGQYDTAIQQGERVVSMDPNFWFAHLTLGRAYLLKGRHAEAIREHKKGLSLSRGTAAAQLAYAYAVAGRRTEAEQIIQDLKARSRHAYVSPYLLAMIYAGLGEKELAFEWLQKAYEVRASQLPWLAVDHPFASLRSDPRFADLVRRVGLPP